MSEVAVPEPLSGLEIVEAITFRVRQKLLQDCFLSPNSAYESFEGKITIAIRAIDCGRNAVVNTTVEAKYGEPLDGNKDGAFEATVVDVIPVEPPNIVRRETDQAVPVANEDSSGRKEVRRVHYARKGAAAAKPKGK